jgi:glycosyltransferase involved in cell wall biosynthesis
LKSELPGELWNRISFRQGLSPAQVATELSEATMLLCPTLADTGPLSVKEAVVAGVPVVGSHIGGLPDYVYQGENGLLFTPGNLSSFVNAIRKACADPQLGSGNVSQQVLLKVRSQLAPNSMTPKFLKLYHDIHSLAVGGRR